MARPQPGWADVAEIYEAWYQTPRGRRYDALEKGLIDGYLGPARGRRLLDIGCGTGHFTRWFRKLGWEVWGLDLEKKMLSRAKELSGGDIVYFWGDAAKLPFADKSFHLSTMITTLESTARPERALSEAIRVSREGVILGVLNSMSLLALCRRMRALFRATIFSQTRFYSGPTLRSMIQRVSRQLGVTAKIRISSWWKDPFGQIPLGAFFVLAIELKK
jgi:ubiquinone/menaquinone biosynthesis C-methylase UbiE